jgi:hypothetical protein
LLSRVELLLISLGTKAHFRRLVFGLGLASCLLSEFSLRFLSFPNHVVFLRCVDNALIANTKLTCALVSGL